jgi:hypothetical protein
MASVHVGYQWRKQRASRGRAQHPPAQWRSLQSIRGGAVKLGVVLLRIKVLPSSMADTAPETWELRSTTTESTSTLLCLVLYASDTSSDKHKCRLLQWSALQKGGASAQFRLHYPPPVPLLIFSLFLLSCTIINCVLGLTFGVGADRGRGRLSR